MEGMELELTLAQTKVLAMLGDMEKHMRKVH